MKRILLLAGLAAGIVSCGDNNNKQRTTKSIDSNDHSSHPSNGTTTQTGSADSSSLSGQSMMSLMQANMNQMKAIQSTGNPDNDFAALMKVHHMGALDMAEMEIAKGTDAQIKSMAQKMIVDQQREIAELNTFLSGHQAHGGGNAFHKEVISRITRMKMEMDHSGSVDKQFVQMMIPHHQWAIDMAKAYIKPGAHEEKLKAMAYTIIRQQQKEIQDLQAWLNKNK